MDVVKAEKEVKEFIGYAEEENIEATIVAKVTEEKRLKMYWRGKLIVDISREFLDTNGDVKNANIEVKKPDYTKSPLNKENPANIAEEWKKTISSLNCCSQKGLVERFDSTIGANTVIMPFGGKYQLTPAEGMVARIPTLKGYTNTGTIMSFGYNPYISTFSPFHGAMYAVVESVTKYVALGKK